MPKDTLNIKDILSRVNLTVNLQNNKIILDEWSIHKAAMIRLEKTSSHTTSLFG